MLFSSRISHKSPRLFIITVGSKTPFFISGSRKFSIAMLEPFFEPPAIKNTTFIYIFLNLYIPPIIPIYTISKIIELTIIWTYRLEEKS